MNIEPNNPSSLFYGPFSLQTFNKIPWNNIRETLSGPFVEDQVHIASQHLLQFLRILNSCPDLDQHFGDPSIKNFFFDDFLFKSIAIIVARNLFESPEIENIFNNCLQQTSFLWIKALEQGHFNLTETFKLILNPFQPYYVTPFISFTRTKGDVGFFNKLVIDLVEHGSFNLIPSLILNKERPLSIEAVSSLCKVVTQLPVVPQTIEIKFKVCAACLESKNSEVRTLGLYLVIDLIDRVPTLGDSFQQTFNQFLRQQDIFNKVYKDPENTPLVMKSKYLLLYQFDHGLLDENDYETLIQSLIRTVNTTDIDLKQVCGTLQASQTKDRLVKCILPRVLDPAPEEITTGHIELLFFAYNLSEKSKNIASQIQDFYWRILVENTEAYHPKLYQPTVERFSKIAEKRDPHKYISTVILDCIENIKQENYMYASIRLTKHFISLCSDTPARDERESSLTMCVNYLCDELGLVRLIVDGLMSLKSSVRDEIPNETSFMTEIQQRIEFIEYLGINGGSGYRLITYELLLGLWKEFVRNSFFKEEKNCIFRLVKNLAERNEDFLGDIMDLEKFFIEEMVHFNFRCDLRSTKEGLLCFKALFLIINESHNNIVRRTEDSEFELFDSEFVIQVFPEELIAFEMIWDIILLSQDQDALEGAIDLLATIYYSLDKSLEANANQIRQACLDQIFQYIKEITEQKRAIRQEFYTEEEENLFRQKCCRCLLVLDRMISESQIDGLGDLKTHSRLAKGELIELTIKSYIQAEDTADPEISENITITLNYNATVFELRTEIGRRFKVWFDEIILMKDSEASQVEIPMIENSRSLYEIGIEKDTSVIARRREIPKAKMTMRDGSLNPRIIRVYKEWFENYSDNGQMSPEQFCGFAKIFTDDDIEPDGADSNQAFQLYGYKRDSYLYFNAFYDLCEQIRQDNSDILAEKIWSGRRNDLKFPSEINKKVDKCSLIAYMISSKEDHFNLLMSLLEWESVIASQAWALLRRIPTNQKLFVDILALKGVKDVADPQDINWNTLLKLESKHLVLYALDIVEYLLDDTSEDKGVYIAIELKKKWQEEFSFYGGFDHLCEILKIFKQSEPLVSMSQEHRRIVSFIKRIQNILSSFDVEILDQNEKQKRALVEFLQLGS